MGLRDVLVDELRDLYSAENQLVKALPKMAKGAKDPSLKASLSNHLEETKGQVLRLKQAFEILGKKATGEHCNGMEGLIEEGQDALEKDEEGATLDVCIIGAASRVEHYEIAGYTASIEIAKALGESDVVALLTETLNEELVASKTLQGAGKMLIKQSAADSKVNEDGDKKPKSAKEKTSEKKSKEDEKKAAPSLK